MPIRGVSLTPEQLYYVGFWNEVESLITTKLAATRIQEELKRRDRPSIGHITDSYSSEHAELPRAEPMSKNEVPEQTILDRMGLWMIGAIIVVIFLLARLYGRFKSRT